MKPKVVFEDAHILVLAKPAGMVVNRAQTVKGKTVQEWVEENCHAKIRHSEFSSESASTLKPQYHRGYGARQVLRR